MPSADIAAIVKTNGFSGRLLSNDDWIGVLQYSIGARSTGYTKLEKISHQFDRE